jgi:hypothetical protein
MTFHVGQKVVCVNGDWPAPNGEATPEKAVVYTVRTVEHQDGYSFLRFAEIVNERNRYAEGLYELSFWSGAFRPAVQPRKELPESITKYLNVPGRVDA